MSVRVTRAAAAAAQMQLEENGLSNITSSPTSTESQMPLEDFSASRGPGVKARSTKNNKQHDIHIEADNVALPDSSLVDISDGNVLAASTNGSKRSASGSKQPILIAVDDNVEAPRPGSPTADFSKSVLKPKSQAKQLVAEEKKGMRATSNKENMAPGSSPHQQAMRVAGPVADAPVTITTSVPNAPTLQDPSRVVPLNTTHSETQQEEAPVGAEDTASKHTEARAFLAEADLQQDLPSEEPLATRERPAAVVAEAKSSLKRIAGGSGASKHSERKIQGRVATKPQVRSSKPPTKPTFTLPGEAIAAKLKAAREARQASTSSQAAATVSKAKDTAKKPSFKARPAPKMTHDPTLVRQTAASRARQSLVHGPRTSDEGAGASLLKRASSVRDPSARSSLAPNLAGHGRASVAGPAPRHRPSMNARARPQSMVFPSALTNASSRLSSASTFATARRPSISRTADGKPKSDKGREVFQRKALERDEELRKKKEKEDAARKARELASQRGREASKAWAEKQKAKQLKAKAEAAAIEA